jgi:uncharacterized protein YqgC (DUF456 family)
MTALMWTVIILLMLTGLCGTLVPVIPDTPLILAGAVLHHIAFGAHGTSWTTLLVLTVLMFASLALEFVSGSIGAKHFGATRWGALGGFLGAIVGLSFAPLGIFVGPLIGVLICELLAGQGLLPATKSTWGTLIGAVAGAVAKFGIGVAMIAWFLVAAIRK